mgnify:CR=1 FL=1
MKKWKKILISLITVFVLTMLPAESAILPGTVCVTEAAPRISSSKLTMIKGQSRTLKITGLKKGQKITWKSSSPKLVTVSASGKLSAIRNESSNLSFHFQKLTDPYEILTQKDASELANDTLDMAVPYWTDLLKGSGITLRSLGFSTAAMAAFNRENPNQPQVFYQSYACVMAAPWSDINLGTANLVIQWLEGDNDGLVSVSSAQWGAVSHVLQGPGRRGISHLDEVDFRRRPFKKQGKGILDICDVYVEMVQDLKARGL